MKATENDNSDKNSMIAIEIEKNPRLQKWFHCGVDEVTFQSVRLDRARDIDLSRHASHPKTTPDGTKRGLKWKKRATAGKTAREWTDENLISYSDKLSQSAQAVVKAMTVQGSSSS